MIRISEQEMQMLLGDCRIQTYQSKELLSTPGEIPQEIFYIVQGLVRVIVHDPEGNEHTMHFALEHQFIADYANFILQQPGLYTLQAMEQTQVVIMPRSAIDWPSDCGILLHLPRQPHPQRLCTHPQGAL
jgi:CRP-like cAMP-binding protein